MKCFQRNGNETIHSRRLTSIPTDSSAKERMDRSWSSSTRRVQEISLRYQYQFALLFLIVWYFYCSWLSTLSSFDLRSSTCFFHLLFSTLHVIVGWKAFQYSLRCLFYLDALRSRLERTIREHSFLIGLSGVSYATLYIIVNHRSLLRQCFALID